MSILNLGLQNCATAHEKSDDEAEKILKAYDSMAAIRFAVEKYPDLSDKWSESMKGLKTIVAERFSRLALKHEPKSQFHQMK